MLMGNYQYNQGKIEKLKYNVGDQKMGEDFFIGGAFYEIKIYRE